MTTIYLTGGLGNQLHQMSLALAISRHREVRVSSGLMQNYGRALDAAVAFHYLSLPLTEQLCKCGGPPTTVDVERLDLSSIPCCVISHPGDAPWMAHNTNPTLVREAIRAMLADGAFCVAGQPSTVAVHFRMGDYLWPRAASRYGVLKTDYYTNALTNLDSQLKKVFFSDDIAAVRRLHGAVLGKNPDFGGGRSVLDDFAAMSAAKYFVAANSTLSLWIKWFRACPNDVAPVRAYRSLEERKLPGLGSASPDFWDPAILVARHPWVLTRRLKWRDRFWL